MRSSTFPSRPRLVLDVAAGGLALAVLAIAIRLIDAAEVIGGVLIVWLSVLAGARLARRRVDETDLTSMLWLDLLLVLVVISGLTGVGLLAAAIR